MLCYDAERWNVAGTFDLIHPDIRYLIHLTQRDSLHFSTGVHIVKLTESLLHFI
jgi:hypothetical protein